MVTKIHSNNDAIETVVRIVTQLHSKRQRSYPEVEHEPIRDLLLSFCNHPFSQQLLLELSESQEQYLEHFATYCTQRYHYVTIGQEDTEWCLGSIEESLSEEGIYRSMLVQNGYPDDWVLLGRKLIINLIIQFMRTESVSECIVVTINHLKLINKHLFKSQK